MCDFPVCDWTREVWGTRTPPWRDCPEGEDLGAFLIRSLNRRLQYLRQHPLTREILQ